MSDRPRRVYRTLLLALVATICLGVATPAAHAYFGFDRGFGAGVSDVCTFGCSVGSYGGGDAEFESPMDVAESAGDGRPDGRVWVTNENSPRVDAFDVATGAFEGRIGKDVRSGGGNTCVPGFCQPPGSGSGAGEFGGSLSGIASSGGRIWVADPGNNRVSIFDSATGSFLRSIGDGVDPAGGDSCTQSTGCREGTGGSGAGQLINPTGVAVDGNDLFVSDPANGRIVQYTAIRGEFVRAFGKGVNPDGGDVCTTSCQAGERFSGVSGSLYLPADLAVSGDNLYVVDSAGGRLSVFNKVTGAFVRASGLNVNTDADGPANVCTTACGPAASDSADAGALRYPYGVAVIGERVFVGDTSNQRIAVFDAATGAFLSAYNRGVGGTGTTSCTTTCAAGEPGGAAGQLQVPYGLGVAGGDLVVANTGAQRVDVFTADLTFQRGFARGVGSTCTFVTGCRSGTGSTGAGDFTTPTTPAVSGGRLYVPDAAAHRVNVFDAQTGVFAFGFGTGTGPDGAGVCTTSCYVPPSGSEPGQLFAPTAVDVHAGDAYVLSSSTSRIDVFDAATGAYERTHGGTVAGGAGDLTQPAMLQVSGGKMFVADSQNHRVSVFDAATGAFERAFGKGVDPAGGDVCTAATECQPGSTGTGAGEINNPFGLAVSEGSVYVVAHQAHRVSVFDASTGAFQRAFGKDVAPGGGDVCTTTCLAGSAGSEAGEMHRPEKIAIQGGEAFVYSSESSRIEVFDKRTGAFLRAHGEGVGRDGADRCTTTCFAGTPGTAPGAFSDVRGMTSSTAGVFVSNAVAHRVDVFTITAPVTTDDVPSAHVKQPFRVTLTPTDGGPGVDETYYEIGADPAEPTTASAVYDPQNRPTLSDGQRIRYFSTSTNGNAEAPRTSRAVQIDATAPVTTDDVPTGWSGEQVTVTLSAADAASGVDVTYYTKGADPAAPTTSSPVYSSADKPKLADGEKIRYFSVDEAGNAEAARASSAAKVDTVAPATTDDVPAGYRGAPVTVTLTATDGASGVDETYYTKGADPAAPTTSDAVYDAAAKPTLAHGEKIRYFSTDAVANAEADRASAAAQVDTAAPTTTDAVSGEAGAVPATVTLTASDTGGAGVDATYYTKGTNPPAPTTTSAIYDAASKPRLAAGEKIRYFSVDTVGNAERPQTSAAAKAKPIVVKDTKAEEGAQKASEQTTTPVLPPPPTVALPSAPVLLLEKLERLGRRSLAASYGVPGAGRLEVVARFKAPTRRRPKATAVFARGAAMTTNAGVQLVKLERTAAGGEAIRTRRRLTLVITARFTPAAGARLTHKTKAVVREIRAGRQRRLSVAIVTRR